MEAPMSFGPGDSEPSQFRGGEALAPPPAFRAVALRPTAFNQASPNQASSTLVTFDQGELRRLFGLYGRKVAAGEWRDYAIDFLRDRAVFSVFRRTCEVPLYRIEKNPRLARRQGAYSVVSATGLIIRRGHELDRVLRALDRSLHVVAG
jgi:hypothetical protein